MRDIKFRGKVSSYSGSGLKEGTWVYGGISINDDRVWIDVDYLGQTIVDIETVGQYTGLKDKNGTEIYEGDILRHYINDWSYYVVKQKIDGWEIRRIKKQKSQISFKYAHKLEVIGNIYENPDLLKKEGKEYE